MSIREALMLRDWHGTLPDGTPVVLRRPSALDLLEALEVNARTPDRLGAWMVARHLVEDGAPVFASVDEALAADAFVVQKIAQLGEPRYAEGRD